MYASPTNFLLQSVDTTRDAKQGKPFPESLKCIEDKASSSQLKPTSKEDIRFIHLIYIFYLPYRKSRIFFDGYVNYSRIINVIRYEVHRIPRKFGRAIFRWWKLFCISIMYWLFQNNASLLRNFHESHNRVNVFYECRWLDLVAKCFYVLTSCLKCIFRKVQCHNKF